MPLGEKYREMTALFFLSFCFFFAHVQIRWHIFDRNVVGWCGLATLEVWTFDLVVLSRVWFARCSNPKKKPRPFVPPLKIKAGLTKRWHWHTDNASDSAVSGVSSHSLSRCKFEHKEPEEERQRLNSGVLQRCGYKLRLFFLKIETGCVSLVSCGCVFPYLRGKLGMFHRYSSSWPLQDAGET